MNPVISLESQCSLLNQKGSLHVKIPDEMTKKLKWKEGDLVTLSMNTTGLFVGKPLVHTIGYEKTKIEEFIEKLKVNNVTQVIDVRDTAMSRVPIYRKKALQKILEEHDIFYHNIQNLGAPKEIRKILGEKGQYQLFFQKYEEHLRKQLNNYRLLKKSLTMEEQYCYVMRKSLINATEAL